MTLPDEYRQDIIKVKFNQINGMNHFQQPVGGTILHLKMPVVSIWYFITSFSTTRRWFHPASQNTVSVPSAILSLQKDPRGFHGSIVTLKGHGSLPTFGKVKSSQVSIPQWHISESKGIPCDTLCPDFIHQ